MFGLLGESLNLPRLIFSVMNRYFLTVKFNKIVKRLNQLILGTLFLLAIACKKTPETTPIVVVPPGGGGTPTDSLIALPKNWTKNATLSLGLPKSAAVYEAATPSKAYAFVFDLA